uniref:Putative Glutathione S-transferase n=1 Tax=Magnetococcus massalia (strain MO-1) TaxID=451514 RepID=A0A1S7LIJ8_MAGMO|nr:putative Glutathione S-transferase [Candidatus Magnetococcus massalia]
MTPGSCSTGIHILLEELELLFAVHLVDLLKKEHRSAEYLQINPKGTIPTLVLESGQVLGDYLSIAWWLALRYPKAKLLPQDSLQQAHCLELMHLATGRLHGEGFTRIFTPEKYQHDGCSVEAIQESGREMVEQTFQLFAQHLAQQEKPWLFDHFTIADTALFYTSFWADRTDIPLPAPCQRHYEAMLHRPKVRQVLLEEGYTLP